MSDGDDVTILVYGPLLAQAWQAAQLVQQAGHSVRLLNLRTVQPIDEEAIVGAALGTRLLVTVEDHFLTGGLYSIVAEALLRNGLTAPVLPIALPDRWFRPALLPEVLEGEGLTGPCLAAAILARLRTVNGER